MIIGYIDRGGGADQELVDELLVFNPVFGIGVVPVKEKVGHRELVKQEKTGIESMPELRAQFGITDIDVEGVTVVDDRLQLLYIRFVDAGIVIKFQALAGSQIPGCPQAGPPVEEGTV